MYKRYYTYIHPLHISIFERMGQQTYWTITQMHACTVLPLSNRIWIIHPSDTSIFPSRNKGTAITMTFKIITCPRNRVRTQNDRCGIIVSIIHDVDDTATIREPSREEESRREVWRFVSLETMNGRNVRNLSIVVTAFYMKVAGFWVANNYAEKRRRNVAMFVTIFFAFMGISIEGRDLYFAWGDFEVSRIFLYD